MHRHESLVVLSYAILYYYLSLISVQILIINGINVRLSKSELAFYSDV